MIRSYIQQQEPEAKRLDQLNPGLLSSHREAAKIIGVALAPPRSRFERLTKIRPLALPGILT